MPDSESLATETSSERSIRDELLAAREEIVEREEEKEEPVKEAKEAVRDESGRFAPREQAAPAEVKEPPVVSPSDAPVSPQPVAASEAPVAAPPAWSHAAKGKWAELPADIRAEISKREADVHKGFTQLDEERSFAKEIRKTIAPYEALFRAENASPAQAISSILNTAYILRTADPARKAAAIADVCRHYNIDMALLAQPNNVDPQYAAMQQRIAQLEGSINQQQQSAQQYEEQQVLSAIETFGQDPKHAHFPLVRAHMGALIQAGEAKNLDEAYDMAVWARPDLRAPLLAEQQAEAQRKAEQARKDSANKARIKGSSIRGGPGGSQPAASKPNATVREDLEAALEEARGRV